MSFQTCTMPSQDGRYWASFNEKSFTRGRRFKVYSGIFNGDGTKRGDKCVVKVFKDHPGTRTLCCCEVKKSSKAREMAKEFNRLHGKYTHIRTTSLYWASIDEVSVLKKLFFSGRRKLTTKEVVLFEDDLRVDEEKPGKLQKLTLYMDSLGRLPSCKARDLEAFAHFSYHHSGGELVLCGLEGVHDHAGFVIKTPTVHSLEGAYGKSDLGRKGIEKFFEHHVCNDACRDMIKYCREDTLDEEEEEAILLLEEKRSADPGTCKAPLPACPSHRSEVTERSSDYLEPTAPVETDDACFTQSDHPAGWMLRAHALDNPRPPAPSQLMNIEEEEPTKVPLRDNVNNTPYTPVCPGASMPSNYASSVYSSPDMLTCRLEEGPRVHFSLSVGATSGIETATNLTGDTRSYLPGDHSPSSYHPPLGLRRQWSSPQQCSTTCEDSMARMVLIQGQTSLGGRGRDLIPVYAVPEEPPSYSESQMDHCRSWLQQHHAEMAGPLQRPVSVDSNGNRLSPNLASPRHL